MQEILDTIRQAEMHWGVVTNKPSWLTEPLLHSMQLADQCGCMVSGDTTAQRKPHPEPMLYACSQIGVAPEQCLYIGDARRDIEAGNNANMKTIAARWGYIGDWEDVDSWGADAIIDNPAEIAEHL